MDDKNLYLINSMISDCRSTITGLSKMLNVPRSTVSDMIKQIEKKGVIKKYACILNHEKLGFPIHVSLFLKIDGDKSDLAEFLKTNQNVNTVEKLANDFDFHVSAFFPNMEDLLVFIGDINKKFLIRRHKLFLIVKELKREGFRNKISNSK